MEINQNKIFEVTWQDVVEFDDISRTGLELPVRISVGYKVRDDEKVLGLCYLLDKIGINDIGKQDESEGIIIPKTLIITIKEFIPKKEDKNE